MPCKRRVAYKVYSFSSVGDLEIRFVGIGEHAIVGAALVDLIS